MQLALNLYNRPELSIGFNLVRPIRCWQNRTFNNRRQMVNVWRHAFQVDVGRSGPLVSQEELECQSTPPVVTE